MVGHNQTAVLSASAHGCTNTYRRMCMEPSLAILSQGFSGPLCCPENVGGGLGSRGDGQGEDLGQGKEGRGARTGARKGDHGLGEDRKEGDLGKGQEAQGDWRLQCWCRMSEKVWWVASSLRSVSSGRGSFCSTVLNNEVCYRITQARKKTA